MQTNSVVNHIRNGQYHKMIVYFLTRSIVIVIAIFTIKPNVIAQTSLQADQHTQDTLHSLTHNVEDLWASIDFNKMRRQLSIETGLNASDMNLFMIFIKKKYPDDKVEFFLKAQNNIINESTINDYVHNLHNKYLSEYSNFIKNKNQFNNEMQSYVSHQNKTLALNGPCTNVDFETGTTNGWDGSIGDACTSPTPCNVIPGFNSTRHVIMNNTMADPFIPTLPVVSPGGNYSLRLENYLNGGDASVIQQTFMVTATNNVFTYKYAAVLEDPGHSQAERPYFKVRMYDQSGQEITCGSFTAIAEPPIKNFIEVIADNPYYDPNNKNSSPTLDLYYRPWTTVSVPLLQYVGQNVTIVLIASDCSRGGHLGYAYIDCECGSISPFPNKYICGTQNINYTVNDGYAYYHWDQIGGAGGIVSGQDSMTVTINSIGNYALTLTPFGDTPCPVTMNFSVLKKCGPTPIKTTLCEDIVNSLAATVNLNNYNNQLTGTTSPTGTVKEWRKGLTTASSTLIINTSTVLAKNGDKFYAVVNYPAQANDTMELDFTINPKPVVIFPVIPESCIGTQIFQITGTSPGGGIFSGTNVTSSGLFNPSSAGSFLIQYKVTNSFGCMDSLTQPAKVNALPVLVMPDKYTQCENTSLTLTTTSIPNSVYQWTNGTTILNSTANSVVVKAGITIDNYYVTVTDSHLCTAKDSTQVEGIPLPIVSAGDTAICDKTNGVLKGNVINYSGIAKYNPVYTWTKNGVVTGNTNQLIVSEPGTYTFTLTAASCIASDNALLTIHPLPVITMPKQVNYCEDIEKTIGLDAGSGYQYLWKPSCLTVTVTVDAMPSNANAGSDINLCNATSTTLSGVVPTPTTATGTWTLVSGLATITNPTNPVSGVTGLSTGVITLRWTVSNGTCTSASFDDVTITNYASPTVNAGPDQTICSNNTILAGSNPTPGTGVWSTATAGVTFTNLNNPLTQVSGLPSNSTIVLTWTVTNGVCSPISDNISIITKSTSAASVTISATSVNFCAGTSVTFTANPVNGGTSPTYKWFLNNVVLTGQTTSSFTSSTLANNDQIYVEMISSLVCASASPVKSPVATVTVATLPTSSSPGSNQAVCTATTTLSGNVPSSGTGLWTIEGASSATITNPTLPTTGVSNLPIGSTTFRWTISNGTCSSNFADVIVTRTIATDTANAGEDQNKKCSSSATLSALNQTGTWSVAKGGTAVFLNPNNPNTVVSNLSIGSNLLYWTTSGGCGADIDTINITYSASNIIVKATTSTDTVCVGTAKDLQVKTTGGSGDFTYVWTSSDKSFTNSSKNTQVSAVPNTTVTTYYVVAKDNVNSNCSSNKDSVNVYALNGQQLVVPNLITPNGDQLNDVLIIRDINNVNILPGASIEVYNRWEQRVYASNNYDNSWAAAEIPDGIYYYYIKTGCGDGTYKGWIEIISNTNTSQNK